MADLMLASLFPLNPKDVREWNMVNREAVREARSFLTALHPYRDWSILVNYGEIKKENHDLYDLIRC